MRKACRSVVEARGRDYGTRYFQYFVPVFTFILFLFLGRLVDGVFRDASDLEKSNFGFLFRHIPSSVFRFDISSTEIR